jgi:hypothetical protein
LCRVASAGGLSLAARFPAPLRQKPMTQPLLTAARISGKRLAVPGAASLSPA